MSTNTSTGRMPPSGSLVCGCDGCTGTLREENNEWVCGDCGVVSDNILHSALVSQAPIYHDERYRNVPVGRDWDRQPLSGQGERIQRLLQFNREKDPKYHLRREFDSEIKPHLLQFGANEHVVQRCNELHYALRTTDVKVQEKHYNRSNLPPIQSNLSESVRNVVWAIVLLTEVQRDPRTIDEKIGDQGFTYPLSGRNSKHLQICLQALRDWKGSIGIHEDCQKMQGNTIRFIKKIHQRMNYMFKNSSVRPGARRKHGNEVREKQLHSMFHAMNVHHGLSIGTGLVEELFTLLIEVEQHPSSPFNYPNPSTNRASLLKSCHLEIVLAVCKRLYPKKKFTRPKVCKAVESCYGWSPKSSNSRRLYGDLAAYLVREALGNVEVEE